jgi:hypothetical protein
MLAYLRSGLAQVLAWNAWKCMLWLLSTVFIRERRMNSSDGHTAFTATLSKVNEALDSKKAWAFGGTLQMHSVSVPMFVVFWGPDLPAHAVNGGIHWVVAATASMVRQLLQVSILVAKSQWVGRNSTHNIALTFYSWVWCKDPIADPEMEKDKIIVLECISNDVRQANDLTGISQTAVDDRVPPEVSSRGEDAAMAIVKLFSERKNRSLVVVIHGSPGTGKSITARMVTHKLKGILFPTYNPTSLGQCLFHTMSECEDDPKPLVVVMEEFDVALGNIMNQTVQGTDKMNLDAKDKSTWNTLLDKFNTRSNAILIMTTNKSREHLLEVTCNHDPSILREGRVHLFIEFK